MAGDTPFRAYFRLASNFDERDLDNLSNMGLPSEALAEWKYDDLLRTLLGKRALDEGKAPAQWAEANEFHADMSFHNAWRSSPLANTHPRAVARLRDRPDDLKQLVKRVNYMGNAGMKTKEEREEIFWREVAQIERECRPITVTRDELQGYAAEYPRAVTYLLEGDRLETELMFLNGKGDDKNWNLSERWDGFRSRLRQIQGRAPATSPPPPSLKVTETTGPAESLVEPTPIAPPQTEGSATPSTTEMPEPTLAQASARAPHKIGSGLVRHLRERKARMAAELLAPDVQERDESALPLSLVRWTGGKWRQADRIVIHFPAEIETYYEPFVGGGAVLYWLLSGDIKVRRIRCSDICQPLIEIWNLLMADPGRLASRYAEMWEEREERQELGMNDNEFYTEIRSRFNQTGDPCEFFFLLRTCRIGSVRFNQKGDFTTSFHFGRRGAHPDKAKAIIDDWHRKLKHRDVQFNVQDYRSVRSEAGDFLYLDPPYASLRRDFYHGKFDFKPFFPWLAEQRGGYALSLNGFVGDEDRTVAVPENLYDEHLQLKRGVSSTLLMNGMSMPRVSDSLYVKRNPREDAQVPIREVE